jgi:hypothetical protein
MSKDTASTSAASGVELRNCLLKDYNYLNGQKLKLMSINKG